MSPWPELLVLVLLRVDKHMSRALGPIRTSSYLPKWSCRLLVQHVEVVSLVLLQLECPDDELPRATSGLARSSSGEHSAGVFTLYHPGLSG